MLTLESTKKIENGGRKKRINKVTGGSPSLILIVRLISFGITTRPKSSILLTIPVAFN